MDVNIYIGNHGKKDGIEDYLAIFENLFARQNTSYRISNNYAPGVPNLVIEEFTSYFENRKIERFRRANPDTPLVLVLTEFMEKKWGVRSLNHFSGIGNSALLVAINILVLSRRRDFRNAQLKDWMKLIAFMPVLLILAVFHGTRSILARLFPKSFIARKQATKSTLHSLSYWRLRYHGLMKNLGFFDHIITGHEQIWPQMVNNGAVAEDDDRFLGVIYPEFDCDEVLCKLFVDKENKLEMTGSNTPYRIKWREKLNLDILGNGLNNTMGLTQNIFWGMKASKDRRAAFSLHPPQTRQWPYSSPTRIYRALQYDGNIPVLVKHFGQNPIEDICLNYDGVETLVQMIEYWNDHASVCDYISQKMVNYNTIVMERNNELMARLSIAQIPSDSS